MEILPKQKYENSKLDEMYLDCSLVSRDPITQRKENKHMLMDILLSSPSPIYVSEIEWPFESTQFQSDREIKQQSLFKQKIKFRRQNKIKVFYFDMNKSYDFDTLELKELNMNMTVKKFIEIAVLKYLEQCVNFTPSKIKTQTFSLTVINEEKQQTLDQRQEDEYKGIDHDSKIRHFYGQHLLLERAKCKVNQNRQQFEKIELTSDIFQVELTFENSRTLLKLDKSNKNYTISSLIKEALKKCKSLKSINDFLMVEYDKFKIYPITEILQNIPERKFQVFDRQQPIYQDEEQQKPARQVETKKDKISKNLFSVFIENHKTSLNRKKVKASIRLGLFKTMSLEIVNNEFVESYNQGSILNQIISLICQKESVVRYSFGNLISAYVQQNELVLIFHIKKKNIIKRYKMANEEIRMFLQDIIRLSQLYRKKLLNHDV